MGNDSGGVGTLSANGFSEMYPQGKGNKRRWVPLWCFPDAVEVLRKRNLKIQITPENLDEFRVFNDVNSVSAVESAWRRFKERTGIRKSFHNLRDTFGSVVDANPNWQIFAIRDVMGHKDIKTTERFVSPLQRTFKLNKNKMIVRFK